MAMEMKGGDQMMKAYECDDCGRAAILEGGTVVGSYRDADLSDFEDDVKALGLTIEYSLCGRCG